MNGTEPAGVSRRINAERLVLIGWLRALLLQLAHPLVAAGVADHSTFRASTAAQFDRLRQTIDAMLAITFGNPQQREQALDAIRSIHRRVHGTLAAPCGVYAAGTPYSAEDPALLLWVHATLVESVILVFEQIVGPLEPLERDQYCADSADVAVVLGAHAETMPRSWPALCAFLDQRYAAGEIVVGDQARALASALVSPSPGWIGRRIERPMMSLVAAGLLPTHVRRQYGLPWNRGRAHLFRAAMRLLRSLRCVMPDRVALWRASRSATCVAPQGSYSAAAQ